MKKPVFETTEEESLQAMRSKVIDLVNRTEDTHILTFVYEIIIRLWKI